MNRTLDQVRQCLEMFKLSGIDLVPCSILSFPHALSGNPLDPRLQRSGMTDALNRSEQLGSLRASVTECAKCPQLVKERTQVVFGSGNPHADLMFVGEAPGHEEDLQGLPFVGLAGQLLTKIVESIGLKREEVYIANVLKCRPPGNRNPLPAEILNCKPYLLKQIESIRPRIICALGTFAAQTLLETSEFISALRGRFLDFHGVRLLCTYHPAYLLRNPSEKRKVWEDMKLIRAALGNNSYTVIARSPAVGGTTRRSQRSEIATPASRARNDGASNNFYAGRTGTSTVR